MGRKHRQVYLVIHKFFVSVISAVFNAQQRKKFDSIDTRFDKLERKIDDLDNRQCNLECDFKVMLKMMESFNNKLDSFGQNQERLERIVLRMENDSTIKVRALFKKSDIQDYRLNDHELRIKTIEEKIKE